MYYKKPDFFFYKLTKAASFLFATFVFSRKIIRNEIKDVKGPFVVIANHQAAYDFVNLIGATKRRMTFVISNSFYQSLPIRSILDKIAVIPKQQFQTTVLDMKKIKAVVDAGQPVAIYPAGLMCEDGLSTPVPEATYKLFKWLGVDVYMAKTQGTYFAMPKWAKGFRRGKTTLDIYKLFSKEDLQTLSQEEIKEKAEKALLFDAYREQEELLARYKNAHIVEGLENVVYACPHCKKEFSITAEKDTLRCENCGYAEKADEFGFLHKCSDVGEEIRYISDWSRLIYCEMLDKLEKGEALRILAKTDIYMVDEKKNKYVKRGEGSLSLDKDELLIEGTLSDEAFSLCLPASSFPSLPFSPGKYIEIQNGQTIYRCVLHDGRLAMKLINMVKALFEIKSKSHLRKIIKPSCK